MVDARTDRTIVVDARIIAVTTVCLGWLIAMTALATVYVVRGTGNLWDPLAWGVLPTAITAALIAFKAQDGKRPATAAPVSPARGYASRHRVPSRGA